MPLPEMLADGRALDNDIFAEPLIQDEIIYSLSKYTVGQTVWRGRNGDAMETFLEGKVLAPGKMTGYTGSREGVITSQWRMYTICVEVGHEVKNWSLNTITPAHIKSKADLAEYVVDCQQRRLKDAVEQLNERRPLTFGAKKPYCEKAYKALKCLTDMAEQKQYDFTIRRGDIAFLWAVLNWKNDPGHLRFFRSGKGWTTYIRTAFREYVTKRGNKGKHFLEKCWGKLFSGKTGSLTKFRTKCDEHFSKYFLSEDGRDSLRRLGLSF